MNPELNSPAHAGNHWVLAPALLVLATVGGFALDHRVSLTSQAMLYVLAVVLIAYRCSYLPSVLSALGAVTGFNFFFVPPRWTFEVESQEHLISLFVMLVLALAISHLASALRRETQRARTHARRARQLQMLASALATAEDADAVRRLGQSALDAAFPGPCVLATCGADQRLALHSTHEEALGDGMRSCMRENAVLGPGTGRWPGLDAWYLPLVSGGQMRGAACIRQVQAADTEGRAHAQALATLLGQALGRIALRQEMLQSHARAEREQVQNTLLAAISHDLRTPLAALVGAATSLQTQGERLEPAQRAQLLEGIVGEARYLSDITENTLQLVRLSHATAEPRHDWESVEEIVGAVLQRMRLHDPQRRIRPRVPEGLPLIRGDAVQLAQVLANLLDNALKYSAGAIDLHVEQGEQQLRLSVKDRGPTLDAAQYERIFEPYARNDHGGQRGAGLGLALGRAIAQAHGGTLAVRARQGGGNVFTLTLPAPQGLPPGAPE